MSEETFPGAAAKAAAPVSRSKRVTTIVLLFAVTICIYVADQLSKNWVVANLPEGRPVPVLGEFLQWYFVRNPGAAFSFASGATWVFTILSVVVVGVIVWQLKTIGSRWWALFLGLLLGGVLGNLTDRLTREPGFPVGHVIDFISTPWMMPAIYNIADIGIVGGMILFVIITLFGIPSDGSARLKNDRKSGEALSDGPEVTAPSAEAPTETTLTEVSEQTSQGEAGSTRRAATEE